MVASNLKPEPSPLERVCALVLNPKNGPLNNVLLLCERDAKGRPELGVLASFDPECKHVAPVVYKVMLGFVRNLAELLAETIENYHTPSFTKLFSNGRLR